MCDNNKLNTRLIAETASNYNIIFFKIFPEEIIKIIINKNLNYILSEYFTKNNIDKFISKNEILYDIKMIKNMWGMDIIENVESPVSTWGEAERKWDRRLTPLLRHFIEGYQGFGMTGDKYWKILNLILNRDRDYIYECASCDDIAMCERWGHKIFNYRCRSEDMPEEWGIPFQTHKDCEYKVVVCPSCAYCCGDKTFHCKLCDPNRKSMIIH